MKLAKLCITIAMLLTLVTARPQDITASSKPCASREANQLLERGHATFPTSGYGTPSIVAAAGKALAYFELAVEKDPVCAQAYVALARAESGFPSWPGLPPRERFPKVKEAATKAIELESNNAAAHALLGGAAFNTGEWCAVSFIREIRQHCEKIAEGPHHYVARPDLGDTTRICAHGNYLIVFEPFDDGALILRVLHGARNVPGVLGSY